MRLTTMAPPRDLISVRDWTTAQIEELFELAANVKRSPERYSAALRGQVLALIFEKPSLRTRVTFEVGMIQLGGSAIYLDQSQNRLGERESIPDVARNLERWVDAVVARTFSHEAVEQLAAWTIIPVINALTDRLHPCQALADFFTLREKLDTTAASKLAYVGDGNNVCHSLLYMTARLGSRISVATPAVYEPDAEILGEAQVIAATTGAQIELTHDPLQAVAGAQAVYTDVWASMGQEREAEQRKAIFQPYQVNEALMARAGEGAFFMHCLPAHRGEEVTDAVIDAPTSIVFDQAENRLHVQKAILLTLLSKV